MVVSLGAVWFFIWLMLLQQEVSTVAERSKRENDTVALNMQTD